jgi:hypothetical protein
MKHHINYTMLCDFYELAPSELRSAGDPFDLICGRHAPVAPA